MDLTLAVIILGFVVIMGILASVINSVHKRNVEAALVRDGYEEIFISAEVGSAGDEGTRAVLVWRKRAVEEK